MTPPLSEAEVETIEERFKTWPRDGGPGSDIERMVAEWRRLRAELANLIATRDKNFDAAEAAEARVAELEANAARMRIYRFSMEGVPHCETCGVPFGAPVPCKHAPRDPAASEKETNDE